MRSPITDHLPKLFLNNVTFHKVTGKSPEKVLWSEDGCWYPKRIQVSGLYDAVIGTVNKITVRRSITVHLQWKDGRYVYPAIGGYDQHGTPYLVDVTFSPLSLLNGSAK